MCVTLAREAEALLADPDLVAIGMKGEEARKAQTGERVTYGRVLVVSGCAWPTGHERGR